MEIINTVFGFILVGITLLAAAWVFALIEEYLTDKVKNKMKGDK